MPTIKANVHIPQGVGQSDAVDFDTSWNVLASSLREIHTKNASKLSFEELYRNAYKLVLKKRGETLYIRVKEFEEEWLANEVQPRIIDVLSPALLLASSAGTTVNEKRVAGEKLLAALKQAWEDHNLCMNMTTDVLMYMVGIAALHGKSGCNGKLNILAIRTASTARTSVNPQSLQHQWRNSANMCSGPLFK